MKKDKEFIEESEDILLMKQTILFHAFFINFALILIVWVLTFIPAFTDFVSWVTQMPFDKLDDFIINALIAWKIAGIVLFFVPALATYWARVAFKKMFG